MTYTIEGKRMYREIIFGGDRHCNLDYFVQKHFFEC